VDLYGYYQLHKSDMQYIYIASSKSLIEIIISIQNVIEKWYMIFLSWEFLFQCHSKNQ